MNFLNAAVLLLLIHDVVIAKNLREIINQMKYTITGFIIDLALVLAVLAVVLSIVNHNSINSLRYQIAVEECEEMGGEFRNSELDPRERQCLVPEPDVKIGEWQARPNNRMEFVQFTNMVHKRIYRLVDWQWISEGEKLK